MSRDGGAPQRVLVLAHASVLDRGGYARRVLDAAATWRDAFPAAQVTVATVESPRALREPAVRAEVQRGLASHGVEFHVVHGWPRRLGLASFADGLAARAVARFLVRAKIDLVHAHGPRAARTALEAARRCRYGDRRGRGRPRRSRRGDATRARRARRRGDRAGPGGGRRRGVGVGVHSTRATPLRPDSRPAPDDRARSSRASSTMRASRATPTPRRRGSRPDARGDSRATSGSSRTPGRSPRGRRCPAWPRSRSTRPTACRSCVCSW